MGLVEEKNTYIEEKIFVIVKNRPVGMVGCTNLYGNKIADN